VVNVEVHAVKGRVGILVAGSIENEFLRNSIARALAVQKIAEGSVFSSVEDFLVLPYAAQALSKSCDVVIAASFITNDESGAISAALHNALLQLGVTGGVPIVCALVHQSSLLEAKALLPSMAEQWAKSARSILSLGDLNVVAAPVQIIEEKPVISASVTSVDELLAILKESVKVSCALTRLFCAIGLCTKLLSATWSNWNRGNWQKVSHCRR